METSAKNKPESLKDPGRWEGEPSKEKLPQSPPDRCFKDCHFALNGGQTENQDTRPRSEAKPAFRGNSRRIASTIL